MSISVQQLTKAYASQKALNAITFELKKGEIVGFLGPNGAGKSTCMKILTTVLPPTSGKAIVAGFDVIKNPIEVRKRVGYLSEINPLYTEMYVREYLLFNARVYDVDTKRVEELIVQTGLATEVHKKIGQLSKGYKQRTGLACALLHDPEVLLLDEPTTGLDPNQLVDIRSLIIELGKQKTVLLSTHIMQEVEALCDRVIIINKGQIVADKRMEDLRDTKEQIIEVEFDYRVEDTFLIQLPYLEGIRNPRGFMYQLTFGTSKDMRPVVFDLAHDNELKILQLSHKNKNLESLFKELTSEENSVRV